MAGNYEKGMRNRGQKANSDARSSYSVFPKHEALCSICNHQNREELDQGYLRWESLQELHDKYCKSIPYETFKKAIHNHATIFKLDQLRLKDIRSILSRLIGAGIRNLDEMKIPSSTLIQAVKLAVASNMVEQTPNKKLDQFIQGSMRSVNKDRSPNYVKKAIIDELLASKELDD
jgi:hypothetical protein